MLEGQQAATTPLGGSGGEAGSATVTHTQTYKATQWLQDSTSFQKFTFPIGPAHCHFNWPGWIFDWPEIYMAVFQLCWNLEQDFQIGENWNTTYKISLFKIFIKWTGKNYKHFQSALKHATHTDHTTDWIKQRRHLPWGLALRNTCIWCEHIKSVLRFSVFDNFESSLAPKFYPHFTFTCWQLKVVHINTHVISSLVYLALQWKEIINNGIGLAGNWYFYTLAQTWKWKYKHISRVTHYDITVGWID